MADQKQKSKIGDCLKIGGKGFLAGFEALARVALMCPNALTLKDGDLDPVFPTTDDGDKEQENLDQSAPRDEPPTSESRTEQTNLQKEKVRIHWKSLSFEEKERFLQVSIDDLSEFSNKILMGNDLLLQALSYHEFHKKWKCWMCCYCCVRTFTNSESHFRHVSRAHLKNSVPPPVHSHWISIINNANWEPADASLAFQMLVDLKKSLSTMHEFDPRVYFFNLSWPLSTNAKRAKILRKIQTTLQRALSDEILLAVHVSYVMQQAVKKLEGDFRKFQDKISADVLWDVGLDSTHLCICLLDAPELQVILNFLKRLCDSSSKFLSDRKALDGISNLFTKDFKTKADVVLLDNLLFVRLNENDESTSDDASGRSALDWIYTGASSEENLESWTHLRQERGRKELDRFTRTKRNRPAEVSEKEKALVFEEELGTSVHSIIQASEENNQFGLKINSIAAVDYWEILLFLFKKYIQMRLEAIYSEEAKPKSANEDSDEPDCGDGGGSQTSDDKQRVLLPEGNDVHCTVTSEVSPDFQNVVEKSEDDMEKPSDESEGTKEEDWNTLYDTPKVKREKASEENLSDYGRLSEDAQVEIANRCNLESAAEEGDSSKMLETEEGAQLMLEEKTRTEKDDDEKNKLPSLENETLTEKYDVEKNELPCLETEVRTEKDDVEKKEFSSPETETPTEKDVQKIEFTSLETEVPTEKDGVEKKAIPPLETERPIEKDVDEEKELPNLETGTLTEIKNVEEKELQTLETEVSTGKGDIEEKELTTLETETQQRNLGEVIKELLQRLDELHKSVQFFQDKVDNAALEQFNLQRREVEVLLEKFAQTATNSVKTSTSSEHPP